MIIKNINLLRGTAEISITSYNVCKIQYKLHEEIDGCLLELDYENLEKIENIINDFCSKKLNKIFNKNKNKFKKFKWEYDKKHLSLNLYGYSGFKSLSEGLSDFLRYIDKYIYYCLFDETELDNNLNVINEIKKLKKSKIS